MQYIQYCMEFIVCTVLYFVVLACSKLSARRCARNPRHRISLWHRMALFQHYGAKSQIILMIRAGKILFNISLIE